MFLGMFENRNFQEQQLLAVLYLTRENLNLSCERYSKARTSKAKRIALSAPMSQLEYFRQYVDWGSQQMLQIHAHSFICKHFSCFGRTTALIIQKICKFY